MQGVPSALDIAINSARRSIGRPSKEVVDRPKQKRSSLLEITSQPRQSRTTLSASAPATGWLSEQSSSSTDSSATPSRFSKSSVIRPIWRVVLDESRGLGHADESPKDLLPSQRVDELWPPVLVPSERMSLDLWEQVEENRQVTKALDSIIERPGHHLNPIHITGMDGIGKTHLVTAFAQLLQEQLGPASVRLIRCSLLTSEKGTWPIPPQEIKDLRLLMVEDINQIGERIGRLQELASWMLWQVTCGVQVVLTSDGSITSQEVSGDLRRLLDSSVDFHLPPYSKISMMRMLRRRCGQRGTSLSDDHLQALIDAEGDSIPRLLSTFEKMSIAESDGSLGSNPVEALAKLGGVGTAYQAMFSEADLTDRAKDIAATALHETEAIEFELDSPELEIKPDWDSNDIIDLSSDLSHAARMEEDDALVKEAWSEGFELPKEVKPTEDLLTEFSTKSLDRMADVGVAFEEYDQLLHTIESEMKSIATELDNADNQTLIQLADRLVQLEGTLQAVRPTASELESIPLNTTPEPEVELPDLQKMKELDEYTPEGEWNIDEDDVTVEDLFGMAELQPVSVNVLIPKDSIPKTEIEIDGDDDIEVAPADPRRQRDSEGTLGFSMPDDMDRQVGATRHNRKRDAERDEQERKMAAKAEMWRAKAKEQEDVGVDGEEESASVDEMEDRVVKKIIRQPIEEVNEG